MNLDRIRHIVGTDLQVARRDGEQLLLTLGLPILLLAFFSTVDVLPTGDGEPVDFLTPGIMALAVLSVSFVRVAISLGFDRSFGAIRRFAVTPLLPSEFIIAKFLGTLALFTIQIVVIAAVAFALGWDPQVGPSVLGAFLLGLVAFTALGVAIASIVEGLTSLALANALYVVLLMMSGLVFELDQLPAWLEAAAKVLPSTALAELLRAGFDGAGGAIWAWVSLSLWAVLAPLAALRTFRWE